MKIETDSVELIYSNRICCFDSDPIKLTHEFDKNNILTLIFKFHYDGGELKLDLNSPNNGTIVLDLYNFNNSLGSGTKRALPLGTYKDKKMFLKFFVYKLENCDPILDLTLYLEK